MTSVINDQSTARRPIAWWAGRLAAGLVVVALTGALAFGVTATVAKSNLSGQYPPPGQLIDIGGYRLHLNCIGDGPRTVVFESGNADFSIHWSQVQLEVAKTARACSYDRAGLGWSEPSPRERSSTVMVDELHALLAEAGIEGPYILVGHSLGAINARLFAKTYPREVSGMVMVDPAHEEQMLRLPALQQAAAAGVEQFQGLVPVAGLGLLAMTPGSIPSRGLPSAAQRQYVAILATTDYFRTAAAETAALGANLALAASLAGDLGDLPITVISRGLPDPVPGLSETDAAAFEREWAAMQSELVSLSTLGRQLIAGKSGHYVQLQQPDLVADAIARLVMQTNT